MAKVDLEKFSKEELEKIVLECFDKTELATRLGFSFTNGKVHKKVIELVEKFGISIEHFDKSKKLKARRKYPIIKKNCPVCGVVFETQQGHPKEKITCSYICSNIYFAPVRHTNEANNKTSQSLIKIAEQSGKSKPGVERLTINGYTYKVYSKVCLKCGLSFKGSKARRYCSQECSAWISRHNVIPSFAERVVASILEEINIQLAREYYCGRWFIDFADADRKIAIEVDGKQHELPERKLKDIIKDNFLMENGWQIHRIKWKKLTKEFREEVKKLLIMILL